MFGIIPGTGRGCQKGQAGDGDEGGCRGVLSG